MTIHAPSDAPSDTTPEPSASPAGGPPAAGTPFRWLPIRALGPHHRSRVLAHLMSLNEHDRYLRFGYAASDEHIARYVAQLDFEHDEVFGVFNRRLQLVAMAHLAYMVHEEQALSMAEFGVSVNERGRGRGIGARLFEMACLHARNRGVHTLVVHALTENVAMLKIARQAGARVEREGPDSTALLKLPPDDLGSHLSQLLEMQAAEIDFNLKLHAMRMDRFMQSMRAWIPGSRGTHRE